MSSLEELKVLYLSIKDVENLGLSMREIIAEVEQVFVEKGKGMVEMPPKPGIHPGEEAFIHAMPAYVPDKKAAGIKWVSGYPDNHKIGLPYIMGLIILNDTETGAPLAIMDAAWVTAMRTAAATAVSAKYMANPSSKVMAILGCGVQGRTNLEALSIVCPDLKTIKVYDIVEEQQEKFLDEMKPKFPDHEILGMPNPYETVKGADIVVSLVPIEKDPTPIIEKDWLKEGCFGGAIALDAGWSAPALESFDRIVTDDIGQFDYFRSVGYFQSTPEVKVELSDLVMGKTVGRESETERTLAINLGLAIEDVVTGMSLYEMAKEKGIGTWLPLL